MINKAMIKESINKRECSFIECIYVKSSNVHGDMVSAYAVTKVIEISGGIVFNILKKSLENISSELKCIRGFSLAKSKKWTVADEIVTKYKTYDFDDNFEVIWLKDNLMNYEYHGNAGYSIYQKTGIVLSYPEKLKKAV